MWRLSPSKIYQPTKSASNLQRIKSVKRAKILVVQSKVFKNQKQWEQILARNQPKRIQTGARRPTRAQAKTRKFIIVLSSSKADAIDEYKKKLIRKQERKHRTVTHLALKNVTQTYDVGTPSSSATVCASGTEKCELDSPKYKNAFEDISRNEATQQSAQSSVAIERAEVPFLYNCVLECDNRALEYTIEDHDITLRIPEGAIPEGKQAHIEIGVAAYGPFSFPKDTQPISPVVWLCIQEKDIELQKPFQLVLPHFLMGLTMESICYHHVKFVKAIHDDCIADNHEYRYQFHFCDLDPFFASSGGRNYGILESIHCCFYCLEGDETPELARDAGYYLTRIERLLQPQRNEIYFAVTYFLKTCIQALKEQYQLKDGYHISRCDTFKFEAVNSAELTIIVAPPHGSLCLVGLEPNTAKIRQADLDFWNSRYEVMKLKHDEKQYPPQVKITVSTIDPHLPFKICVQVTGCRSTDQLNMDIIFPLENCRATFISSEPELENHSQTVHTENTKPLLKDAFAELLTIATRWKTIGTLLGIKPDILERVKHDEQEADDRLQKTLREWLKIVNPSPTWRNLIDAVKKVDEKIASQIRKRIADKAYTQA